jgi:hypothetical protein
MRLSLFVPSVLLRTIVIGAHAQAQGSRGVRFHAKYGNKHCF